MFQLSRSSSPHVVAALTAFVLAGLALFAGPVASASAATHWSDTKSGVRLSGSLSVSKEGDTKVCEVTSEQVSQFLDSKTVLVGTWEPSELYFVCPDSYLEVSFDMVAIDTDTIEVRRNYALAYQFSPWDADAPNYSQGIWYGGEGPMVADFTNGSGESASTIAFDDDNLGLYWSAGYPTITVSGTLEVTTASGGLLTIAQ